MEIRQEYEQLQQIVQESIETINNLISNFNVYSIIRWRNFKVRLIPVFNRHTNDVLFIVNLENNEGKDKMSFNITRFVPLRLEEVTKILWLNEDKIKEEINKFKNENVDYVKTIAKNRKEIDVLLWKVLLGYLMKKSWLSEKEIVDKLTEYTQEKLNKFIKIMLLEEITENLEDEYKNLADYNKKIQKLNENYIVVYDWWAKIIYDPNKNQKIIKFYTMSDNFVGLLQNNKYLKEYLPENIENMDEKEILTEFKRNINKIEWNIIVLGESKIKKDTFNKIIKKYLNEKEKLNDENYVVLTLSPTGTEYAIFNWKEIIKL